MNPLRQILPLLALAATQTPAAAAVEQSALGVSNSGFGYFLVPWQGAPIDAGNSGCGGNVCVTTRAQASGGDMRATYLQGTGGGYWNGGGSTDVESSGWITIVADAPGAASFVDATLNLMLTGARSLSANVGGYAEGSVKLGVDVLGSHAWLQESSGINTSPPPSQAGHMWRVDSDRIGAALTHLPVGQPFQLLLSLNSSGSAWGGATASASTDYRLSLIGQQPAFTLPAGYSAWSSDWSIEHSLYCPGGCAAVPEPAGWSMMGIGLALLPWARRRLQATFKEDRS